jgi:murein DD-endopeptidase MepM/ murein hydrolase activator NlpD
MNLYSNEPKQEESQIAKQAKRMSKNALKKVGKKIGKKVAKAVMKAAIKGAMALGKALLALLSGVSIPVLVVLVSLFFLVIISFAISSFALGGDGKGLDGTLKVLNTYIVQESNSTIDSKKPDQLPYRVPEGLIAAVVQIDGIQKGDEDDKAIIHKFTQALKPDFVYENFDEWTETETTICKEGECKKSTSKVKKSVPYLTSIIAWNGKTTTSYESSTSEWETTVTNSTEEKTETDKDENGKPITKQTKIPVKTTTKTRYQSFVGDATYEEDYSKFDEQLTGLGLKEKDKKLVEAIYETNGGTIHYTEWLNGFGGIFFDGVVTPGSSVPAQYMPIYLAAEKKYKVHWYVLAAIHFVETGFSTTPVMVSGVGAEGHAQFMPCTWLGWAYPACSGVGGANIPKDIKTNPAMIKKYGGYGRDANKDGKADPWDINDAIETMAYYLSESGYVGNPRGAILNYNHAEWYADKVLATAEKFKNEAIYSPDSGKIPPPNPGGFMRPTSGPLGDGYGPRSTVVNGSNFHQGVDIRSAGVKNRSIVAAADGIVVRSYLSDSYGNCVIIQHNMKGTIFQTLYAHMQNRAVSDNQTVKQGQYIGTMGGTGSAAQGVHLHFEMHSPSWNTAKSNSINPVLYIHF